MKINIEEQKGWLESRLEVIPLTSNKINQSVVKEFNACKQGKRLEKYLHDNAWEEDISGGTKVYLVKDKKTGVTVFFFALKSGLLYRAIDADEHDLSMKEKEILDLCVKSHFDTPGELTIDDVFSWYEDETFDKDRLRKLIEERIDLKANAKLDLEQTAEQNNIMRVAKTFPGIVLTHFCKSEDNPFSKLLAFPLGFYVFWEIIVKKVLYISSILGCQYLYLFAADDTEPEPIGNSFYDYIYDDIYDGESVAIPAYKLVEYYKNELKFEEVQGMTILKPTYDFNCFSLIQPVSMLENNRKAAWIQHTDVDK